MAIEEAMLVSETVETLRRFVDYARGLGVPGSGEGQAHQIRRPPVEAALAAGDEEARG
jgi:hypothetical protein